MKLATSPEHHPATQHFNENEILYLQFRYGKGETSWLYKRKINKTAKNQEKWKLEIKSKV